MLPLEPNWKEIIGKIMAAKRWTLPTLAEMSGVKYAALYYLLTKDRQPTWKNGAALYGIYMEVQKKDGH